MALGERVFEVDVKMSEIEREKRKMGRRRAG